MPLAQSHWLGFFITISRGGVASARHLKELM